MTTMAEETVCELCAGSGWIAVEGNITARRCGCRQESRRRQRMAAAAIPKRYVHCTIRGFGDRGNASLMRARQRVAEFIDCWPSADRGFLLMGPCGAGKTHLAVAMLQEIIRSDKPGKLLFSNFQDLVQKIHASFSSDDAPSKSEILRPLLEADLLVLDELGSHKPTQFVQETLYYIINTRYNDEKTTVFTTNYLDRKARPSDETLEERIGSALRSRLWEMTERIEVEADDYRRGVVARTI